MGSKNALDKFKNNTTFCADSRSQLTRAPIPSLLRRRSPTRHGVGESSETATFSEFSVSARVRRPRKAKKNFPGQTPNSFSSFVGDSEKRGGGGKGDSSSVFIIRTQTHTRLQNRYADTVFTKSIAPYK